MSLKSTSLQSQKYLQLWKVNIFLFVLIFSFSLIKANNIQITQQPLLLNPNTEENTVSIQFNLSWENSWRVNVGPSNWDGAWVFVKFKISEGNWQQATLSADPSDYSIENGNGVAATIQPISTGKGVFIYRYEDGFGNNNWEGIQLQWNYGADSVPDNAEVIVQCFAIEMCYVPEGAFYVGSGGDESDHFKTFGSNNPYQISSENEINVGQTNGYLWSNNNFFIETSTIPTAFPKGFAAFWMMKYEITQEQYADFLNTLTDAQKSNRYYDYFNQYRHFIKLVNGVYGCDGNNNDILNEADDGQNIACNYLSWADGTAYADWSGMRPMTELEFEKACRGTVAPVANEYAWGNTVIVHATGTANERTATEQTTPDNANCVYDYYTGVQGPVRVGNFARTNSTRQSAGASYYGIMELSGNLSERPVTVSNIAGRSYTGLLGDGALDTSGNSNVTSWPGVGAVGSGFRGGDWLYVAESLRISDRQSAGTAASDRSYYDGFRCVAGE